MLKNMKAQAQERGIPKVDYCGYITFNEMSVQVIINFAIKRVTAMTKKKHHKYTQTVHLVQN